jgi:hypothetical protein
MGTVLLLGPGGRAILLEAQQAPRAGADPQAVIPVDAGARSPGSAVSIQQIAARGLPGAEPILPVDLSGDQWRDLSGACFDHGIAGLLADAVHHGEVRLGEPGLTDFRMSIASRLLADLRAEAACAEVTGLLDAHGIRTLVLKGLAVAHLDHDDPSHRATTDVDLLVGCEHMDDAVAVLTSAGYRRDLPERRRGHDSRFAKDVTFHGPAGVEIDLHRTLVAGPFGMAIDLAELRSGTESFTAPGLGRQVALDAGSRLLHACYTVVVGDRSPRLATVRDIALLVHKVGDELPAVVERASRWRAGGILADGISTAMTTLGLDWEVPLQGVDRRPDRWRRHYPSGHGSPEAAAVAATLAMPVSHVPAYLFGLVAPSREYRRARRKAGRHREASAAFRALLARCRSRSH